MGNCLNKKNTLKKEPTINMLYIEDIELHYDLLSFVMAKHIPYTATILWTDNIVTAYTHIKNKNLDLLCVDRLLNKENLELADNFVEQIISEKLIDPDKIIFISALQLNDKCKELVEKGVHYVRKPIDVKIFKNIVTNILEKKAYIDG